MLSSIIADPHSRCALVDQINGLVRKPSVINVAFREPDGGRERLVRNCHAVVLLIVGTESLENPDGLFLCRLLDGDRLEASLKRGVLFDVFSVLIDGRRSDDLYLSAREGRLQDIGRIESPLCAACPDNRVQLIDEKKDIFIFRDLADHIFNPLLEFAAVFCPRNHAGQIEHDQLLSLHGVRHITRCHSLGQSLHDGCLADAGLADQAGVILCSPRNDLHDAENLAVSSDHRIQPSLRRKLCEVTAVLVQRRCLRSCTLQEFPVHQVLCIEAPVRVHDGQRIRKQLPNVNAHGMKKPRGHALCVPQHDEQNVLRASLIASEHIRELRSALEDCCAARRKSRLLVEGNASLRSDEVVDHPGESLRINPRVCKKARRSALRRLQEPRQEMLCPRIPLSVV